MPIIDRPSPNHDARSDGQAIDILLLHYTGMPDAGAALERMCDPAARVSAHYCIDEDGTAYRLVAEERRAWHAGVSCWAGQRDINARSIGIELVNPGHEFGYRDFPPAQIAALIELARGILARHPIPPHRVLGHSDVAPARKADPGERFPWAALAAAGIGLWPDPYAAARAAPFDGSAAATGTAHGALARFGYDLAAGDIADVAARQALVAFQRHFRPERVDGRLDDGSWRQLQGLLARLG